MSTEGDAAVPRHGAGGAQESLAAADPEAERRAHVWFLESMDKVNRAIQGATDLEQMMGDVLEVVLEVLACDRAWLMHPCDPDSVSWTVVMERTRPGYTGALELGLHLPTDADAARVFRVLRDTGAPVRFGPGSEHALPAVVVERFGVQSQLAMALYPKIGGPYAFGLHHCAQPHAWAPQEERLFQEIGRRLGDALTSVLAHHRLQDGELRYREIFENTSDAILVVAVTEGGRFELLDCNPAAERMIGTSRAALAGRFLDEFPENERASTVAARYRECCERKVAIEVEQELTTRAGHWHMQTTLVPVRNAAGRIYRLVVVSRNVSEQKRAEAALRESEAKLEAAQRIAHVGYWDRDLAAEHINWSDETYRIFGLPPQDHVVGVDEFQERIHPADRPLVIDAVQQALEGGQRYDVEYRAVRPDGELRFVHSQGDVTLDAAGRVCRMFGTVQDVTERKRAERALLESHSLLNAVIEGSPDAIFVKDLAGRYLMANSASAHVLGKPAREVLGRDDAALFPPQALRLIRERDGRVMASGRPETIEETAHIDGETRTYLTTKGVYRDEHGDVIGLIGLSRDVTALKRLEEQLRQAQKLEAVGRLAGGIAHDFNNLLTVINSYSEMIFGQLPADDPNRELIAEVQRSGERAANLTRQLLAFSRKQILQPRVVRIDTLLSGLRKLLRPLLGADIELVVVPNPALGLAQIDPGQFEQAIVNLAVNARDAMPGGGRLTIATRNAELDDVDAELQMEVKPGRYVLVTVSDSGQGIDRATRARIFEPFFTTKGPGKGTGLGLAMVYGFVKQSGGHIEVESELGRGTTFRLFLPRAEGAAPSVEHAAQLDELPRGAETILLVEDEDAVRALSRRVLQACGYTVLEAANGLEALRIAEEHPGRIDALVTDLVMPRMGGQVLADRLVAATPGLRVLFMSGHAAEPPLRDGPALAGASFLAKPFSANGLAQRVRELLDA
jgi:PAS domain S-box-containing protein